MQCSREEPGAFGHTVYSSCQLSPRLKCMYSAYASANGRICYSHAKNILQSDLSNKIGQRYILFHKEYSSVWVHFINYILNAFITLYWPLKVRSKIHSYLSVPFQLNWFGRGWGEVYAFLWEAVTSYFSQKQLKVTPGRFKVHANWPLCGLYS